MGADLATQDQEHCAAGPNEGREDCKQDATLCCRISCCDAYILHVHIHTYVHRLQMYGLCIANTYVPYIQHHTYIYSVMYVVMVVLHLCSVVLCIMNVTYNLIALSDSAVLLQVLAR